MYIIFTDNKKTLTEARKNGDQIVTISNSVISPAINAPLSKDATISKLLRDLGIPAHIKGFKYCMYLFNYCIDNPGFENEQITKTIYPTCAKGCNSTSGRVERAIRHAVKVGFNSDVGKEKFNKIFGPMKKQPVNSHFISQCALYLREHLM